MLCQVVVRSPVRSRGGFVSSWGGFVSLEVSSGGGFGSLEAGVGETLWV